MKIYAIRDELVQEQKDLAYLLYYGQEKQFYIELPENADAWENHSRFLLEQDLGSVADRSDRPPEHR